MTTLVQRVNIFKVLLNLLSKFSFIFLFISLSGMSYISLLHTENFPKRTLYDQTTIMDVSIRKTFFGHYFGKITLRRGCCKNLPKKNTFCNLFKMDNILQSIPTFIIPSKTMPMFMQQKSFYAHPKSMHLFIPLSYGYKGNILYYTSIWDSLNLHFKTPRDIWSPFSEHLE